MWKNACSPSARFWRTPAGKCNWAYSMEAECPHAANRWVFKLTPANHAEIGKRMMKTKNTSLPLTDPFVLGVALCVLGCLGQSSVRAEKIVLVAGGGVATADAPATACKLNTPFGVHFDRAGNLFIVE